MTLHPTSRIPWQFVYGWLLLPLLLVAAHVVALGNPKLRASLRGRRGLWLRLREQARARDPKRRLVWVHAASAGELLMALPVLERLLQGGAQGVVTVTSVSGLGWAQRQLARLESLIVADYLPFDTAANARRMLALLRPDALVYVKYDLWPNLVWEARAAGVRQYLLAATLHAGSRRGASSWSRSFYRALYPALDAIWPVTESHAGRFREAIPEHPALVPLGDPRFDSVLERKAAGTRPELPGLGGDATVIVAGSTWPGDEVRILPALREGLERFGNLVVIVAPHEIDSGHLEGLAEAFSGFPSVSLAALRDGASGGHTPDWRVLLVDEVGLLFDLYALADAAYVGGGFGEGVHNVLEPCAQGAPVMFGPRHGNDAAAADMIAEGVAWEVHDASEFRNRLLPLLEDASACAALGERAEGFVRARSGAAQRAAEAIAGEWA